MFETYGVYALVVGVVLSVVGYVWLLARAWKNDWRWFVGILLIPLVIPIFASIKFRRVAIPALLLLIGVVLVEALLS